MLDGRAAQAQDQTRRIAMWMSPVLTALTGNPVSPAQLLGEEEAEIADRVKQGEKKLAAMMRKLKRARKG